MSAGRSPRSTNPTVKAVRALHMSKAREETGQFLAEGLKIVTEAVELGRAPRTLLFAAEMAAHPLLRRAIAATEAARGEVIEVSREILDKISRRDNPQTVLAVFDQAFAPLAELQPAAAPCWVALEAVRDPGNLGTIVRTADAAGCGGGDPGRRLLRSLFGRGGARDDGLDLRRADRAGFGRTSSSPGAAAGPARWSARCSPPRPTSAPRPTRRRA